MTDKEKAIVMAYTGACTLTGEKFQIFHKYIEDIMGRPIMIHEIGFLEDTIKEKSKADFIALCEDESNSKNPNKWIPVSEKMPEEHEWLGTKRFGTTKSNEVYVTFETPKGDRFTKHLSFQNGKLSVADQQTINAFYKGSVPVAWMPLPEPYKAERGQDDD